MKTHSYQQMSHAFGYYVTWTQRYYTTKTEQKRSHTNKTISVKQRASYFLVLDICCNITLPLNVAFCMYMCILSLPFPLHFSAPSPRANRQVMTNSLKPSVLLNNAEGGVCHAPSQEDLLQEAAAEVAPHLLFPYQHLHHVQEHHPDQPVPNLVLQHLLQEDPEEQHHLYQHLSPHQDHQEPTAHHFHWGEEVPPQPHLQHFHLLK
mmetsp:Transcript_759/g.1011  ORF Transcript_759/g.1011 Transcript_759/m.1011 type:complete len:206 (-) Transcript_759:289-906(-)